MQEYLIAFAVGGTICALSQLLMDKTKLMPGRIMVILVVTGVVLGSPLASPRSSCLARISQTS